MNRNVYHHRPVTAKTFCPTVPQPIVGRRARRVVAIGPVEMHRRRDDDQLCER
jgi:hypothetical protein